MEREHFKSRLGFILMSAGCAIGCGNVWKFPWMVGKNGGGIFLFFYILFSLTIGIPVLSMELAIGRASGKSPVKMFHKLEKTGTKWHFHGVTCFLGVVFLMSFYSVVTGWMIYYFGMFLTGNSKILNMGTMLNSPVINVSFLFFSLLLTFILLSFGIKNCVERVVKYMMILLFIVMFGLAIVSVSCFSGNGGLSFYLKPDFSKVSLGLVRDALNQSFFSLSLGIGSMAIFGSYVGKEKSLVSEAMNIAVLDAIVAVTAGLIIFPACFQYNVEVTAGPSLLFSTMTEIFNNMEYGRIIGTIFFMLMVFAAFSTELAVCECIVADAIDFTGLSRKKCSALCFAGVFLLSLTTALGFSVLRFEPFGKGTTWLDLWDFIVSNNLIPLGSMVIVLFCTLKCGWGWENSIKELNLGGGLKIKNYMKPFISVVIPVVLIYIYISGMIDFFHK